MPALKKINKKYLQLLFLSLVALSQSAVFAKAINNRIGLSIESRNWNDSLFSISFDSLGFLPQKRWSIGGELNMLGYGFILSPRLLYWQYPNLVGFYGGPKISMGSINNSNKSFFVGIGGEGGYLYRFPTKFDLGCGVQMMATNYNLWLGVKITAGYLIP